MCATCVAVARSGRVDFRFLEAGQRLTKCLPVVCVTYDVFYPGGLKLFFVDDVCQPVQCAKTTVSQWRTVVRHAVSLSFVWSHCLQWKLAAIRNVSH